jgi:hypothetical protein
MQRKGPVASTGFLAAQFHELCSRSAAVRVGRLATLCRRLTRRSVGRKADPDDGHLPALISLSTWDGWTLTILAVGASSP